MVDVEQGKLLPAQRVVITGNRIEAVGKAEVIKVPRGAQVVDARGKYLIPGLWDMHTHTALNDANVGAYAKFLAYGVTGVREAGRTLDEVTLDTLRQWRREISAGAHVGPRLVFAGVGIRGQPEWGDTKSLIVPLREEEGRYLDSLKSTESDTRRVQSAMDSIVLSDGRLHRLVDSLREAGADFVKILRSSPAIQFAIAAEARRVGIPFGGHADQVTAIAISDSGASIIDHLQYQNGGMYASCMATTTNRPPWTPSWIEGAEPFFAKPASIEQCRAIAEHFRRNGTWWVPTLAFVFSEESDQLPGMMSLPHQVGMPIMAGTDTPGPTAELHRELRMYVTAGLTPLEALQAATLNPAKYLRATDSLGTIARGKLADVVLLDADPLADISNTTAIRAVVANGRYYDRATLDSLLTGN